MQGITHLFVFVHLMIEHSTNVASVMVVRQESAGSMFPRRSSADTGTLEAIDNIRRCHPGRRSLVCGARCDRRLGCRAFQMPRNLGHRNRSGPPPRCRQPSIEGKDQRAARLGVSQKNSSDDSVPAGFWGASTSSCAETIERKSSLPTEHQPQDHRTSPGQTAGCSRNRAARFRVRWMEERLTCRDPTLCLGRCAISNTCGAPHFQIALRLIGGGSTANPSC